MSTIESHESTLPPVLFEHHMTALLGIAPSTMRRARKRRTWPFADAELARFGRKPRWSRDLVLAALNRPASAARTARR